MTLEERIRVAVVPTGPEEDFIRRLKGALYLYKKGRVDLIMMSGAPSYLDELAARMFEEHEVKKVVRERCSRNTGENVRNCLDALSPLEAEVTIVTNDYHGPRTWWEVRKYIFRKSSLEVKLFTVKSRSFPKKLILEAVKMLFPKGPRKFKRYLNKFYL